MDEDMVDVCVWWFVGMRGGGREVDDDGAGVARWVEAVVVDDVCRGLCVECIYVELERDGLRNRHVVRNRNGHLHRRSMKGLHRPAQKSVWRELRHWLAALAGGGGLVNGSLMNILMRGRAELRIQGGAMKEANHPGTWRHDCLLVPCVVGEPSPKVGRNLYQGHCAYLGSCKWFDPEVLQLIIQPARSIAPMRWVLHVRHRQARNST